MLHDGADRNSPVDIIIELKQNAIPQVVLEQAVQAYPAAGRLGVIMLALVDGVPRTLSLKEMLHYYILHQEGRRHASYEVRTAQGRRARPYS